MTNLQRERYNLLRKKFLSLLSDEELDRQVKKCPNRWVWSAVELEGATRKAKEYNDFFELGRICSAATIHNSTPSAVD